MNNYVNNELILMLQTIADFYQTYPQIKEETIQN